MLHVRMPAGDEIDILDTDTGRLVGQVKRRRRIATLPIVPDGCLARVIGGSRRGPRFPRECCGLIEGERHGDTAVAVALHATRNLAEASDRFAIDPAAQFALLRALRGTGRDIIGCYHSHPNGHANLRRAMSKARAKTISCGSSPRLRRQMCR